VTLLTEKWRICYSSRPVECSCQWGERAFCSGGTQNNDTERAIRGFVIGRNNWKMIDTVTGAKASAIVYSITETAKANMLNPYQYLKHGSEGTRTLDFHVAKTQTCISHVIVKCENPLFMRCLALPPLVAFSGFWQILVTL
jgi:hypothetical protein